LPLYAQQESAQPEPSRTVSAAPTKKPEAPTSMNFGSELSAMVGKGKSGLKKWHQNL